MASCHIPLLHRLAGPLLLALGTAISASAQDHVDYLKSSVFYVNGTMTNSEKPYNWIGIRKQVQDTFVNGTSYHKYQWTKFRDYSGERQISIEYECQADGEYVVLDGQLQPIHRVRLSMDQGQFGWIFGVEDTIVLEYQYPSGQRLGMWFSEEEQEMTPDDDTPRKYYLKSNPEVFLVYQPRYNLVEVFEDGRTRTKYLIGDVFSSLSSSIENWTPLISTYQLHVGDELQFVYRMRYYSDSLEAWQYENDELRSLACHADTLLGGQQAFIIATMDYSYDVGSLSAEEEIIITVTDSGYYSRFLTEETAEFTPADTFKPDYRIRSMVGPDGEELQIVYLSGYIYYQIGDTVVPLRIEWTSDSYYQGYRLSGFPFEYYTIGGLEGHISYIKTEGSEYGVKLVPPTRADNTHVRQVAQVSRNEIRIEFFVADTAEVKLTIDCDQSTTQVLLDEELNPGWHVLTFATEELERGRNYGFSMDYRERGGGGSGGMTTGFYATR